MKNLIFEAAVDLPFSRQDVFAWHECPGAFERLSPPWVQMECKERTGGIRDGARVVLVLRQGPVALPWILGHEDYLQDRQFVDRQIAGPFHSWRHSHLFADLPDNGCRLTEHIEFLPPVGLPGRLFGGPFVKSELRRLFRYRHRLTRRDLELKALYGRKAFKIMISGASGLIGRALVALLRSQGHTVLILGRDPHDPSADIVWDPTDTGEISTPLPGDLDAFVHLSGENVASSPWTEAKKNEIRHSRVASTECLTDLILAMDRPPSCVIMASAVGFYGDRGGEPLSEDATGGTGFLAEVCRDWEAAAAPLVESGRTRVAHARIGAVVTPQGGMMAKLLPIFKAMAGGVAGSGEQYVPWVSIEDATAAIYHAIAVESLSGPFNVVAPQVVTNRQLTATLARVLKRPALVPVPAAALEALYGEMSTLVLDSTRALPTRLKQTGYRFMHEELSEALEHLLGLG